MIFIECCLQSIIIVIYLHSIYRQLLYNINNTHINNLVWKKNLNS